MNTKITVIKRDGSKEPLQIEKIQKQIEKACSGITDVYPSMVEVRAQIEFHDGMTTSYIDKLLINAAVGLINDSEMGNHNYQYVAGRLKNNVLRKEVYGQYEPSKLYDLIKSNVAKGFYTKELLEWYSEKEWNELESYIDYEKDNNYAHSAIEQLAEKYLVKDRFTKKILEIPQVRYIVAAATAMHAENSDIRLQRVKEYYEFASDGHFTLATPVLAGLGTPTKQFSSCVVIKVNDSLNSIFAAGEMVGQYAAKRAGIGLDVSRIRPLGAPIRGGEVLHTGVVPFIKKFFSDMRCTSQGGIRNSSATVWFQIWHYQFDDLIVLKNNQGTEETRCRHMDYGVVMNGYFWKRFKNEENITLFDPNEVPDMYEAFYRDTEEFIRLYEINEKRTDLRKKVISSKELISSGLLKERTDTGRIYLMNVDNVMNQGSYDSKIHPVYQSNLCLTGDSIITIKRKNGKEEKLDLQSFVEQFELGMIGSKVKSYDICSSTEVWSEVSNAAKTATVTELIEIIDEFGNIIRCTPDHMIYTKNRGYVKAAVLNKDDVLCNEKKFEYKQNINNSISIKQIKVNPISVYDITVPDTSCFFANEILVHNCAEINIPTTSFENNITDDSGLIGLCTLSSINWGKYKHPAEMKKACYTVVRCLSNLLAYQDFLSPHSARHNAMFEPLGIGITNLAYWHAKRGFKYGDPNALKEVKRWMEHMAFYCTEASVQLAKERGSCTESHNTYYGKGVFPWERRAAGVNELTDFTPELNWEPLREDLLKYGIRNSVLFAIAPTESSSITINSTNGIALPMNLISVKESKGGSLIQVVPEYQRLKNKYQLMWDQTDCIGYLKTAAVLAAYIDQSISTDTFYNPAHFPDNKIPRTLVAKNLMLAHYWGLKSIYYSLVSKLGVKEEKINLNNQNLSENNNADEDDDSGCAACKL